MKRYDKAILVALIVVFGAGIFYTASGALSTYVTIAEAKESNRTVQVKGTAVTGSMRQIDNNSFSFELEDMSGSVFTVTYEGALPVNLFESDYAVVKGRFNDDTFMADSILVKCPSKFQSAKK
ncbi:MAG TPA: cytochrome c maturation protein CcmE [Dehalococcoidales bacterium]|nr:cytochrome c maturation protein CcmE [Dehalococcoidales bacterium]